MKKWTHLVYVLSIMFVFFFAAISARSQEEVKTVTDSAFQQTMRPQVLFPHDQHNETAEIVDCSICHHVYKEGKLVEGEASEGQECSECHTLKTGETPLSLIKVYHLQCKRCHTEKKAGPIVCGECHRKQG